MVYLPDKQGVEVKGAVLVSAGGAFQFRSNGIGRLNPMLCKVCLMVLVLEMVSGYLILING